MNSVIAFSLKDVGMFILWAILIVVLVYIVRILIEGLKIFKNVKKIIETNGESIGKILDRAPDIANNVSRISDEVANGMEVFRPTVENSAEVSNNVTEEFKNNNDLVGKISSIFHTVSMGKNLYNHYFTEEEIFEEEKNV